MKSLLIFALSSILMCGATIAQTIPDTAFIWLTNGECVTQASSEELFVKVEQDPVLTQFNKLELHSLISNNILELNLSDHQSGTIKMKLLFAKDQMLCVTKIGTNNIELGEFQLKEIIDSLSSIERFENGKQRNIEVNCQGILYVSISQGKVDKIKNVNFSIN